MLAHHGFAPTDILLVLVPLALLAVVLFVANRRAQRLVDATSEEPAAPEALPADTHT